MTFKNTNRCHVLQNVGNKAREIETEKETQQ